MCHDEEVDLADQVILRGAYVGACHSYCEPIGWMQCGIVVFV